jgi:hypothetical protein
MAGAAAGGALCGGGSAGRGAFRGAFANGANEPKASDWFETVCPLPISKDL